MIDSRFVSSYAGVPGEVANVRREVGIYLDGCSVRDDVILIVSELASNAIMHSNSADAIFTVRVELCKGYAFVECEDLGGPWLPTLDNERPHGLDVLELLTPCWGITGGGDTTRVVWARVVFS
jgi:two-component sensor histidine kinase